MSQYLMRLDDASEYMDAKKWDKMESLLDRYGIKPIVGVIPNNKDPDMVGVYPKMDDFWEKVHSWKEKGWAIALHGCNHVFETNEGGINPVNKRSEFAGVPLEKQKEKIRNGYRIFRQHNIAPEIFFAPAHTFDENTLVALKEETDIRIISDTIANDIYFKNEFYFVPQQSGWARRLPFRTVTFCYHPNVMNDHSFIQLENFLKQHKNEFSKMSEIKLRQRTMSLLDRMLKWIYFVRRR